MIPINKNLEQRIGNYLLMFRGLDSSEIAKYTSEFGKMLMEYKREEPSKAFKVLNEYRRIRYWRER